MALKPNGIPKLGSLDDAQQQVRSMTRTRGGSAAGTAMERVGLPAQTPRPRQVMKPTPAAPPSVAADRSQPVRNAPSRPTPTRRKSPEAAAKQVVANSARRLIADVQKAPPKAPTNKSWWDRFSDDHKLSADKSYADYKRLMGDN